MDNTFIIIIMLVCGAGFFGLALTVKNLRIRLKDSIYLTINALSALIFVLVFLSGLYYVALDEMNLFLLFQKIALLPFLTICISGYYYHEAFIGVHPPIGRLTIFLISFTFAVIMVLINLLGIINSELMNIFTVIVTFSYSVFFHSFASWVHARIYKMWKRRSVKLDFICTVSVACSSFLVVVAFSLEWLGVFAFFSFEQILLLGIAMIIMSFGIGVLAINNLKVGDYVYFIPVPIHMVLIYNQGGIMVYSQNVQTRSSEIFKKDTQLVTGGLRGFTEFFREILGMNSRLAFIDATEYHFLFNELPEKSGTIVLIVSGENHFLKKSLERLNLMIDASVFEILNAKIINQDKIKKYFDEYITKSFPYLILN